MSNEGVQGGQVPISLDGKHVDITCPEKIYWKYVQKVAPLHDSRSSSLPGSIVKALQNIQDCKTVLDVCGGTGRIARYLIHSGHDVKVVDLSEDMLRIARRRGLDVDVQDARDLKELSNSWDAVICLGNSLGGIPSRAGRMKAIQEMARVSRKRVIIDCTNQLYDFVRTWLPMHVRKLVGCYRPGLRLRKDVVTGTNPGDIIWHDRDLDGVLYHYVYNALGLRNEMARAGLVVKFVNNILSRRVVLVGVKR